MPEKDPATYSMLTYLWVAGLSAWGGVVGYIRKMKNGTLPRFSFAELIGDIVTSGFVGVVTFWLCEAAGIHGLVTAALVGISGHMGSRALFTFEKYFENQVMKRFFQGSQHDIDKRGP